LHPGANHLQLETPSILPEGTAFLLLQNEIPLPQTMHYLSLAAAAKACAVFNPSPMLSPEEIRAFEWGRLGWLVVNEGEMQSLLHALPEASSSGLTLEMAGMPLSLEAVLPDLFRLATHPLLQAPATPGIILTLGPAGSVTLPPGSSSPFHTSASTLRGSYRDTTGAGDTFLGFFVGSLMRGLEVAQAVQRATTAAGMAVEREGAMQAVPSWEEVEQRTMENAV
jgi:ribokinase